MPIGLRGFIGNSDQFTKAFDIFVSICGRNDDVGCSAIGRKSGCKALQQRERKLDREVEYTRRYKSAFSREPLTSVKTPKARRAIGYILVGCVITGMPEYFDDLGGSYASYIVLRLRSVLCMVYIFEQPRRLLILRVVNDFVIISNTPGFTCCSMMRSMPNVCIALPNITQTHSS